MIATALHTPMIATPPSSVVALINPYSGMGRGRQVIRWLTERKWSAEVKVFETEAHSHAGHYRALEYAQATKADRLIISGGDGTLMETLTVMLNEGFEPIPISMIRAGTGNVVASDLDTPRRILPALRQAFGAGIIEWWDVGQLEDTKHVFALRASAGHDALTIASTRSQNKQRFGTIAYALPALRELVKIKPVTFKIQIDQSPPFYMQGVTAFVAVTNRMAGIIDFVLSHDIHPSDGVLHVGVINPQRLLQNLPQIINQGALEGKSIVRTFPVHEQVMIESNPPQLRQVDGELLGDKSPLHVRTIHKAIPFITPFK